MRVLVGSRPIPTISDWKVYYKPGREKLSWLLCSLIGVTRTTPSRLAAELVASGDFAKKGFGSHSLVDCDRRRHRGRGIAPRTLVLRFKLLVLIIASISNDCRNLRILAIKAPKAPLLENRSSDPFTSRIHTLDSQSSYLWSVLKLTTFHLTIVVLIFLDPSAVRNAGTGIVWPPELPYGHFCGWGFQIIKERDLVFQSNGQI
jgi:hypothetical protein